MGEPRYKVGDRLFFRYGENVILCGMVDSPPVWREDSETWHYRIAVENVGAFDVPGCDVHHLVVGIFNISWWPDPAE